MYHHSTTNRKNKYCYESFYGFLRAVYGWLRVVACGLRYLRIVTSYLRKNQSVDNRQKIFDISFHGSVKKIRVREGGITFLWLAS